MEITEKRISEKLRRLGVPANVLGFAYIKEAISLIASDYEMLHSITKKLYPTIAKNNNTKANRVERAIRSAIETMYHHGDIYEIQALGAANVQKGKFTNAEFLGALYECLKYEE